MVWKRTAIPVTHSSDRPYFTTAEGPISHSPLPIDAPRTMAPGPTIPSRRRPRVSGGAGSSARFQGSSPLRASGGRGVTGGIVLRAGPFAPRDFLTRCPRRRYRRVLAASEGQMRGLKDELRHATRMVRRHPGFSAMVIATMALGIGLNTAVFSLLDALLLRPPAVVAPERLVHVYSAVSGDFLSHTPMAFPDYEDLRDRARRFGELAAYAWFPLALDRGESSELVMAEAITSNYFAMLGVVPALGRAFSPVRGSPRLTEPSRNPEPRWMASALRRLPRRDRSRGTSERPRVHGRGRRSACFPEPDPRFLAGSLVANPCRCLAPDRRNHQLSEV